MCSKMMCLIGGWLLPGVFDGFSRFVFRPNVYFGALSRITIAFSGLYSPGAGVFIGFSTLVFNPKVYLGAVSKATFSGQ